MRSTTLLAAVAAVANLAVADLLHSEIHPATNGTDGDFHAESFNCGNLAYRVNQGDCQHMSRIGMVGQGKNSQNPNGRAWIGNNGPFQFTFTNKADTPSAVPVIAVLWLFEGNGDYQAMCVNVRQPYITVSLPNPGDSVTVSVAQGQVGGFAGLYNHVTNLNQYGQISNTWGEFNTVNGGATFDVSREVTMSGNRMHIQALNGCVADYDTCSFQCTNGQRTCGDAGTYAIQNCGPPNPRAHTDNNGADGGCAFGDGGQGHLDIQFKRGM